MPNSSSPVLKQFQDLRLSDFDTHPIWVNCHVMDYDEEWYEDTDEETFRPWLENPPVDPDETIFLVSATFVLKDGTSLNGFATPQSGSVAENELGNIQPHILTEDGPIGFWNGITPLTEPEKRIIYDTLKKTSDQLFPIHFTFEPGLTVGKQSGTINGFLSLENGKTIRIN